MKLRDLERHVLDDLNLVKAEFSNLDEKGDGVIVALNCNLWRAWRVRGGRKVTPSSGWWVKVENAVKALDTDE